MRRAAAPVWLGVAGFVATTVLMTVADQRVRSGLAGMVGTSRAVPLGRLP